MLACQRHLFDIPRDVSYLNTASYGPLPIATQEAARAAVGRKGRPWTVDNAFASEQHERARAAAARLINADPSDVALIPSISYAVATAAKLLTIPAGSRVLVLTDDHSSPVLEWTTRAEAGGNFSVEKVTPPADGDWTSAVLSAIERPGAPPLALASISSLHWSQGCMIDVDKVAAALRKQKALFMLDATQGVGAIPLDVKALDPDFVAFPTYKWVLGPYGRAFIYVAKCHQNGIPLEQAPHARRAVKAENDIYFADTRYVPDARRFDMGERDHFISMEMASLGMELIASWGVANVRDRVTMLNLRLADGLKDLDVHMHPEAVRTPHILSLGFPRGMPTGLAERLARDNVFVAQRIGRIRISPHVYNDEADIDRCIAAFKRHLG
jgi:selenocysteine lyase/cysteine desulfurase